MTVTPALSISREIAEIRKAVQAIRPISRHDTHCFVEDKDGVMRRLDQLDARFRTTFGGTPARFETGTIAVPGGRFVRVERRRRKAA